MLIPTQKRMPIAKDLSYPVGAEIISRLLEGVPQYEVLKIYFVAYETAATIGRRITNGKPVVIFEARYYHHRPSLNRARSFREFEEWELRVQPVPRENKFEARLMLVDEGLQRIRLWLTRPRPPVWHEGVKRCRLQIVFDGGAAMLREEAD